ncbi:MULTISPECIES: hypothetical protein [unclassified Streptomyces]|uniref:hypothetical protein n=1 Tax=unclassified Streptomyces TaxID=2593676 RepID=UPI00386CE33F
MDPGAVGGGDADGLPEPPVVRPELPLPDQGIDVFPFPPPGVPFVAVPLEAESDPDPPGPELPC